MKKVFFLPAMMLAAALTSCNSDEDVAPQSASATLGVNVTVSELTSSRAMVYGTKLGDGAQIGVSVVESDGTDYDDNTTGYLNVGYTASGENAEQTWGPSAAGIMLSGTAGKAVAYFPFDGAIQNFDFEAIPVNIAQQKDWMWAAPATVLSDASANVTFQMQHAQTAVNVKVIREASYTGAGNISALSITSEGLATTGELNATDGSFDNIGGANTEVSIAAAFQLVADDVDTDEIKENEKENPYMFIPASDETKAFLIKATIDDKPYSINVDMAEAFQAGKVYKISVKISNTGLEVDEVVILNDWTEDTSLSEGNLTPVQP